MPNTHTRPDPDSPSAHAAAAAADQTPNPDWLLARACAPGRLVDKRLRSRGLIKTVSIKGPDARSVQLAISAAFSDILRVTPASKASRALVQRASLDDDPRLSRMLGLQQPWAPLRKIHKDSRLRFLSPSEMVTPALWDVAFLASSVVMKASGVQRLYITQREAYLQDHPIGCEAFESGWTWQRLRELNRVYPDSQSSCEIPEADALEECWAWNDRLDEPPSHRSSLSLRHAPANRSWARSSSSSPQQFFTGRESPILSTSPTAVRAQSPLVSRSSTNSRPPHVRTNSIPPSARLGLFLPSSQQRRQTSSHSNVHNQQYERRASPSLHRASPRLPVTAPANSSSIIKRRQSTRSPSLIPRNTPRWSRPSMSRSPSLAPFGPGFGDDRGERRTTPFCYATPYSNAAPEPYPGQRAGSRGPMLPPNVYYPDDDEHMDEDRGSSTDPYDSEMTNDADVERAPGFRGGDYDEDIDVYEDEPDELDDVDTDGGEGTGAGNDQSLYPGGIRQSGYLPEQEHGYGQAPVPTGTLPEDEPWPGIEDMSDGENVDPSSAETHDAEVDIDGAPSLDVASDVSSQPSEYPSTQRAWHAADNNCPDNPDSGVGFRIHEDGDVDVTGVETQWA